MVSISLISNNEFENWNTLWKKYLLFYESAISNAVTEKTWERIQSDKHKLYSFGAYQTDGNQKSLIGFTNFLYHPTTWSITDYCYLEDLFVEKKFRGSGAGKALIEAVWEHCKTVGVNRLYWKTKEDNYVARILYDRVANCSGFVEYEKEQ